MLHMVQPGRRPVGLTRVNKHHLPLKPFSRHQEHGFLYTHHCEDILARVSAAHGVAASNQGRHPDLPASGAIWGAKPAKTAVPGPAPGTPAANIAKTAFKNV